MKGARAKLPSDAEEIDAHADPRVHLEATEQLINDVDGQLREAAMLAAQRERALDEEWRELFGDDVAIGEEP